MSLRKASIPHVEVDMVPLIDIISLLLMFLVMVGDMSRSATAVKMKLPRADMARDDGPRHEGRIVVQLTHDERGRYFAEVEKNRFELVANGGNKTLLDYLQNQIARRRALNELPVGQDNAVLFPVKLRLPADAPMREVERVVMTLARAGLVNVEYAAQKKDSGPAS